MSEVLFEATSICKVIEGFHSTPKDYLLKREYDVDVDRRTVHQFFPQDSMPRHFGNRDWIYKNDGPEELGAVGVWAWNSRPSNSDPEKDYVRSSYQPQIHLVFVKVLKEANSLKALVGKIKNGIEFGFKNACKENWMILFKDPAGDYTGVYCERGTLESYSGSSGTSGYLNSSITRIPKVSIDEIDIYKLDNQKIYRYLDIDPLGEVLVQSTNEIVKNSIINRATWKSFNKFTGGTHTEHNLFKEFLSSISADVYQEVSEKCGCDQETAKVYVDDFVGIANKYIDGEDIETDVLVSLVDGNEDLRERYEKIVEERWLDKNQKRIEKKEEEINSLAEKKGQIEKEIKALESRQETEDKYFNDSINLHKKTLEDLDAEFNRRINTLKDNLGAVLADNIYFERVSGSQRSNDQKTDKISFMPGIEAVIDEELVNAEDVADLLSYNLGEAGVSKNQADVVSAFLTSAIHNRNALILAGPNGKEIADAISFTLFGQSAGRYVSWNNTELIESLYENDESVVIFDGFCKTDIEDILPEIASVQDKICIFITPYSEDLAIEPPSLFNYALPLLTECFVDSCPHREWVGGKAYDNWGDSIGQKTVRSYFSDIMKSIGLKQYLRKKYLVVLENAISILNQPDLEDYLTYFTALIPYSIATCKTENLYELIENEENIKKGVKAELLEICGE